MVNCSDTYVCKLFVAVISSVLIIGCGGVDQSNQQPTWEKVDPESLSGAYQRMYERAETAKQDLGGTLLGRVSEVMRKEGPKAAIEVCNVEASGLTQQVSEKHNVRIGRTSHKLRNPDNKPPEWMKQYSIVDDKVDKQVVLKRGDTLAVASPIRLAKKCATCHGPKDKLSEPIKQQLNKHYPNDRATGFEPGDLRGWFWVTATKSDRS